MHKKVTPEKQDPASALAAKALIGLYRFCKKHRLRPYRSVARAVTKFIPGARYAIIELYPDVHFRIDLLDGYWTNLLLDGYAYEPEILFLLERFKFLDYAWIDCGANYGLWSLIASSQAFGNKAAIAVEAVASTYGMLMTNRELNQRRFPVLKNAIEEISDRHVTIAMGKGHADASIYSANTARSGEDVETISIDDVIVRHKEVQKDFYILKLDVEGAEIAALKGAASLLTNKEVLIVYEDHGHDGTNAVSDFILGTLGYKVYYCDEGNRFSEMASVADITAVKTDTVKGYNFIALKPGSQFYQHLAPAVLSRAA